MYDSTNPFDIPIGAPMVAGYVDGLYKWSDAGWQRFPEAIWVRIAVFASTNDGQVLDVENGDATPAQAPGWAKMRLAAGQIPTLYFSLSLFGDVNKAMTDAGVKTWGVWVADWTGSPFLHSGTYATQYDHPPHSGGHYDLSIVADYWPGVDPPPTVSPPPPANVSALDAARASWSNFATTVTQTIPQAVGEIAAYAASLGNDF